MFDVAYNGKPFSDFGIEKAICKNAYDMPELHIETTHVDGRSGDLHFNYGDLQNINVTYLCTMGNDFKNLYPAFCEWLYTQNGYCKLEDDLYSDKYRMAAVLTQPTLGKIRNTFEVSFSCTPYRYYKSGDEAKTFSESGVITNPSNFDSYPMIRVTGTGDLKIGAETITILENPDYIDIDCALQDAYHDTENRNSKIKLSNGEFFKLHSGENNVVPASGMTVQITPKWVTL